MEEKTPLEITTINLSHITLRPTNLSDADDLLVWSSDEKVTEFCTWGSYTSKKQAILFIKMVPNTFSWYRSICFQNRAIGSVFVILYCGGDKCRAKTAEIGYILARKYWGKGIVSEAVRRASKAVFGEYPHLERLEALTDLDNVGSQRVLDKAGFQREGVLRNYMFVKGRSRNVVIYIFSLVTSRQSKIILVRYIWFYILCSVLNLVSERLK